jgi:SNF2 family DNA or RNA helicase
MEKYGADKSSFLVLQALTRLRQLANHPQLIHSDEESGKFEEVTRMLQNIIAENHKVLIFSSFVEHLKIYETFLKQNKLKYAILTGQTQNRQQVIEDFQNDPKNQVFLISLKAGGVGLNLTAADYVFLLDPWWNPAAENQAINRAHRIGQDKKVFVYRFISSDSIEEKILQLQERKSELADLFINTNNPFKALTPERIQQLFE